MLCILFTNQVAFMDGTWQLDKRVRLLDYGNRTTAAAKTGSEVDPNSTVAASNQTAAAVSSRLTRYNHSGVRE